MEKGYATIREVAEYFGVSVSTVRNWLREGVIPDSTFIKVKETYRFNMPLVEAALLAARDKKAAAKETKAAAAKDAPAFDISIYNQVEENDSD